MKKVKKLDKMIKKGFRGYPIATIAFYGPDDKHATKVAVGIITEENGHAEKLERFYTEYPDIRQDREKGEAILEFIKNSHVRSVVITDRIIGCPHQEGIDYPDGEKCPHCPFWAIRDRFSGEIIQ